jgi:hypothetical protein
MTFTNVSVSVAGGDPEIPLRARKTTLTTTVAHDKQTTAAEKPMHR